MNKIQTLDGKKIKDRYEMSWKLKYNVDLC